MLSDEDVYRLIRQIRKNWSSKDYNFDRCIRALGMALLNCPDELTSVVYATIEEAGTRQMYQLIRNVAK